MGTWDTPTAPPSPPGIPAVREVLAEYNSRVSKLPDSRADQIHRFVIELGAENPVAVALLGIVDVTLTAYETAKRMYQTP